jgi:hypothetical protein
VRQGCCRRVLEVDHDNPHRIYLNLQIQDTPSGHLFPKTTSPGIPRNARQAFAAKFFYFSRYCMVHTSR